VTHRDGSPRRRRSGRTRHNAQLAARLTASVDTQLRQLALLPPVHISDLLHETPDPALPDAHDLAAVLTSLAKAGRNGGHHAR
jgi:predicted oxidoreductase